LNRFGGARSNSGFTNTNGKGRILWAAAGAALSPIAFVQLSENNNGGTDETAEGRMLAASRDEIAKKLKDDDKGFSRFRHGVVLFLDLYFWEPLCTGLRFLHLVAIFVPLIVSVPALWLGPRVRKQDNERTGTIWWYRFLVKSMERAGPAFIKVYHSQETW
jgi:aarF domain-containing kinase